jgi:hypothetical protein
MRTATACLALGALIGTFDSPARAQGPVGGQRYQVPAGYEGYGAGTTITYYGYNYTIQGDGTMIYGSDSSTTTSSGGPVAGQRYQVPAGYEGYGAGTTITYYGYNYTIQGDGTMIYGSDSSTTTSSGGPVTGQRYQVPAGYEGYGAGTAITYYGYNYTIQGDGTMQATTGASSNSSSAMVYQSQYGATYQPQYGQTSYSAGYNNQVGMGSFAGGGFGGGGTTGFGGSGTHGNVVPAMNPNGSVYYVPANSAGGYSYGQPGGGGYGRHPGGYGSYSGGYGGYAGGRHR